jgi:hypothetical protein
MPRFHLHIRTPAGLIEDEEGTDLPDHAAAIVEAVRGARGLMKGEVTDGTLCLDQSIEIHDGSGQHVRTVSFSEALRIVHDGAQTRAIRVADSTPL